MPKKTDKKNQAPVIALRGCSQHNLQNLDLDIPLGKLTVVTGPSGSGKSSLAFHTLYAEGQRRYVETFSPYVRQFFDRMDKPLVRSIEGIPPAIAIEQKNHIRTTRSTIGTLTEINDYLKLLFARLAKGYDPTTGENIQPDTPESAATWATQNLLGENILITFPIPIPPDAKIEELLPFLNSQGYLRIHLNNQTLRTDQIPTTPIKLPTTIQIIQDRLKITPENQPRLLEALEASFLLGKGHATLTHPDKTQTFTTNWTNPKTGFTLRPPTPALFSFNSPLGACPKCKGFGRVIGVDLTKTVPDTTLSIKQGAIKPFQGDRGEECQKDLIRNAKKHNIDITTPWQDLDQDTQDWIYYGDNTQQNPEENTEELWKTGHWYGVKGFFDWLETKAYKMHIRVFLSRYRSYTTCHSCRGNRLQPESLCFKIEQNTLPQLWAMPISELLPLSQKILETHNTQKQTNTTLKLILTEINSRLHYLDQVGLSYLTLDRPTRTLSGGEIERVNLTTCLGASLTGTLFVLDEPTVGLHPRDIHRLIGIMHNLRDKGNTLVVVEHEETVMKAADNLIDIGPGAGQHGGTIIFQGNLADHTSTTTPQQQPTHGTLPWLTREKTIPVPQKRRKPSTQKIQIKNATRHNINQLNIDIPLGIFLCLTGVSGSGKSTLAHEILYLNTARKLGIETNQEPAPLTEILGTQHIDGIELIDQTPVARTPRSTPAVFLGAFEPIRQLFTNTPDAKARDLKAGFFSFNSGEGRCDRCAGNGHEKVEMQFLSDIYVTCPDCEGKRYKPSTLEFLYRGKSIHNILDSTVTQAIAFYQETQNLATPQAKRHTTIIRLLTPLIQVGLGYLKLGQALNTLSGGESQRLKLCQLLSASSSDTQKKLLILDEPTTGLHFSDIENLLTVLQKLVDTGHSLLVIEHNLDIIKSADWILDLGPEAGKHGGQLIAQGTPEQIAKTKTPTAQYIAQALSNTHTPNTHTEKQPTPPTNPQPEIISLKGARHHNLKNISIDIPRDKLVVISGLSGSGKSTLAFDILFAEGQRRFLDSMSAYARQFAEQLEKPEIDQLQGLPPTVAIEQRISQGGGKSTVATVTELWNFIRLLYSKLGTTHCPDCQIPVEKQSIAAIEKTIRAQLKKGPIKILAPLIKGKKGYHTEIATWATKQGFSQLLVDRQFKDPETFTPLERFVEHDIDVVISTVETARQPNLPDTITRALEIGKGLIKIFTSQKTFILLSTSSSCPSCNQSFEQLDPRLFSFNSPHGWCKQCKGHGKIPKKYHRQDTSRFDSILEAEIDEDRTIDRMDPEELIQCPECTGSRINPIGSSVRLQNTPIAEISHLSINQATQHFKNQKFTTPREKLIARDIIPEISQRLNFLQEVGLGYLHLNRSGNTLSGGESQRIRLAAQLGSNLRGVLYILDEPTIGLHPRDNQALLKTLTALRNQGNSLIIVEHDEDTIFAADHLIDLGPAAGRLGGEIVYQGKPPKNAKISPAKTKKLHHSPTYRALSSPIIHPTRGTRRPVPKTHPHLKIKDCHANNLKNIDIEIPLARLTVLTGISGSGKSTILHQALAPAAKIGGKQKITGTKRYKTASGAKNLKSVYQVDQSPIGKTSRSCPATYVKIFDHIRALFAQLPEARMRGFGTSRFSFNTDGGRCPNCKGNGRVKLEMDFLPSTWVHCEECNGMRYNPATLEINFRQKHIGQILAMTIDEAATFFQSQPRIAHPLKLMADTGLGYLQLGQPSPTLSGGEAQRIKLVSELIKGRSAKTTLNNAQLKARNLYLIEEPTVGLHLEDVKRLIDILHRLVEEGHTVVVIEHHISVAAEADWILDIGPEAGENGGEIVAQGTPETVATAKNSHTAPFLKTALEQK